MAKRSEVVRPPSSLLKTMCAHSSSLPPRNSVHQASGEEGQAQKREAMCPRKIGRKRPVWDAESCGALPASVDENKSSWIQSVVPAGKGVAIPSSGECPEPSSETTFIRIGMCRGIQHTCIAYQSMSKRLES